jgi:hypothetical protein
MTRVIVAQQLELRSHCWTILFAHCCSTITSDNISATMTHVMWREEHLWNITVLQRVNISSFVVLWIMTPCSLTGDN